MSLKKLYTNTVSTQRLSNVTGSFKETWKANLASLTCHIQPVTGEQAEVFTAYYKTFKLWCATGSDVRIGDRIINGADTYTVQGVRDFKVGSNGVNHLEAIILLGESSI